jgi:hypothetical protein
MKMRLRVRWWSRKEGLVEGFIIASTAARYTEIYTTLCFYSENFMNLYVAPKKKSARRAISAETTAPTFRAPRVFSSLNTRAHESRKLSLVQSSSSTDHSHLQWCGCHPFPILSPARVFSSSPLPSGIASCRSKSEFGLSSPHHQSGNLSAKFCRTDYILSPPTSHCLLWAEKVEAFAFFPTNIWSHAFCSFGLGVKLACERAPIGW